MKKMTNEQVKDYVECEGLGYAVQCGISADAIADPAVAEAWRAADAALTKLSELLGLED